MRRRAPTSLEIEREGAPERVHRRDEADARAVVDPEPDQAAMVPDAR